MNIISLCSDQATTALPIKKPVIAMPAGPSIGKITVSPVVKQLDEKMKLKSSLKKLLGLFEVPAENEKQSKMEGMLDG